MRNALLLFMLCPLAACGDDEGDSFPLHACDDPDIESATCVEVTDAKGLLAATNSLSADTTIVLGKGTFAMNNEVSIQNVANVHILGQGTELTILDWAGTTAQVNGIAASGTNGLLVQDFTVKNSVKDGIRVEASDGVTYRKINATWDTPEAPTNGAYGIYPVKSKHVLVEDSSASNASDAGLYVGQCQYAIIRRNEVFGNVAGLEIENTQYADVYENNVHDNTGGLVIFDLPGNPIVGRDIRVHDNNVHDNNGANFAPGGTVAAIPVGTGTFAMASRRVEIVDNMYSNNDTVDIAIVSGLIIEGDMSKWTLDTSSPAFVGGVDGLNLLPGFNMDGSPRAEANLVSNFRSENIRIAGNSHAMSGDKIDLFDPNMLGIMLNVIYGGLQKPVDSIVYDTIGETDLDSNDNHLCAGGNTSGTLASLDFAAQAVQIGSPYRRFDAPPFGPAAGQQFDCNTIAGGAIVVWDGN
ncbi:MAG: parallel beta-helix domain-containing protein [Kofleriaceae bacterium]|nr:parallel beta-helix domain-containing protein [Kofleriaceae bacterium]